MLRKIKLLKERGILESKLQEVRKKEIDIAKREQELEVAIEESQNQEDLDLIEDEIGEIEKSKTELSEEKQGIESKIEEIDNELKGIDEAKPEANPEPKRSDNSIIEKRGGDIIMKQRYFAGMTRETMQTIVERAEVKDFITEVRAVIDQKRAVTGGELGIPTIILGLLRDELHKYSKLINKVNLRPVAGKGRVLVAGAIPEAVWTEACATLNELALDFKMVEVDGYKVGGFIPICNATLADSSDIDLANQIMYFLAQAIGFALDKAILYGTNVKMPMGIVTRLAQATKPSDYPATAPAWVDLHTTNISKIDSATLEGVEFFVGLTNAFSVAKPNMTSGKKFWAMNTATAQKIKAKSLQFNAAGALVASAEGTMPVDGGEIVILDFMPDGDIIGGYGSGYLLAERDGMEMAKSTEVRFIQDQTVFKATARYDGEVIVPKAFMALNINNGTVTTTITFAPNTASPGI